MEVINNPTLEDVLTLAQKLSPSEKIKLVQQVVATLDTEFAQTKNKRKNLIAGALADLGTAPSAEDFEEARRNAWKFSDESFVTPGSFLNCVR